MISKVVVGFIEKIKTDRFYFDSLVLTFFTVLGNLFAFLVNIIYTRTLPPGQYGAVMSINSIINILGTIAIAFRMFNVRETSDLITKGQITKAINISYRFTLISFIVLVIFFTLLFPTYGYIKTFINVDYLPLFIAVVIVIFTYLINITSSLFQSLKMFFILGIITFSYPFLRFIFTYPYIIVWDGYIGATASMLVGIVASFVFSSLALIWSKKLKDSSSNDGNEKINLSYFFPLFPIVVINMLYSILNFGDVIFSRRYFDEVSTDIFAVASTIAKANLFVIIPISYVVLPRMIEDFSTKGYRSSVMALFKGVILAVLTSFIYAIFIVFFGDVLLRIFGDRYIQAKPILVLFTFAFIPIGVSFILINYSITFKNWYFIIPLLISDLILILGFILFHGTFTEMILVDMIAGLVLLFSMMFIVLVSKESKIEVSRDKVF